MKLSEEDGEWKSVLTPLLDRRLNLSSQGRQFESYILYKSSRMFYTMTLYRRSWNCMETKRSWQNASSRTRWKLTEHTGNYCIVQARARLTPTLTHVVTYELVTSGAEDRAMSSGLSTNHQIPTYTIWLYKRPTNKSSNSRVYNVVVYAAYKQLPNSCIYNMVV